jgi:hypothetical protein
MAKKFKKGDLIHPACPHCGCSLLCYKNLIDGEASIKLTISPEKKWNRYIYLCRIWGDFNKTIEEKINEEQKIKEEDNIRFYCPHCYSLLNIPKEKCKCNFPMFSFGETDEKHIVGTIEVCSRYKCHSHRWKPISSNHEFKELATEIVKSKDVKKFKPKKQEEKMEDIVKIKCSHCGKSLIHPGKTVAGSLAVHFKALKKGTIGEKKDIFLSAKFGDFRKGGYKFPKGTIVQLFCPHCGEEFEHNHVNCATCGEKLIILFAENGTLNMLGICPTVGCLKHKANPELPTDASVASP